MRTVSIAYLLSSMAWANTGGLAGSPEFQFPTIKSVRQIQLVHSETVPLPTGIFTKFEKHQMEEEIKSRLQERLHVENSDALVIEDRTWSLARGKYDSIRAESAYQYGELRGLALSTTEKEGWQAVDGWDITIRSRGWSNSLIHYSSEPLPQDAVILNGGKLQLRKEHLAAVRKSIAWHENFEQRKINPNELFVILTPQRKIRYWVADWEKASDGIVFKDAAAQDFLFWLNGCEWKLAIGPD